MSVCPKCRYRRGPADGATHPGVCPSCGIAYGKFLAAQQSQSALSVRRTRARNTLFAAATLVPATIEPAAFWGRLALFLIFALWGAHFILAGVDWNVIGGSFMHNVHLPFHEFGHVLFGPFGRFLAILGGSLLQVLVPLIFVAAFSLQRRDNFAASICLWWCGQSFIDVSPYIADAPYRSIPLIGGLGEEAHDWGNLLTMTGTLDYAETFAWGSFSLGSGILLISWIWGGWLLREQYRRVARP